MEDLRNVTDDIFEKAAEEIEKGDIPSYVPRSRKTTKVFVLLKAQEFMYDAKTGQKVELKPAKHIRIIWGEDGKGVRPINAELAILLEKKLLEYRQGLMPYPPSFIRWEDREPVKTDITSKSELNIQNEVIEQKNKQIDELRQQLEDAKKSLTTEQKEAGESPTEEENTEQSPKTKNKIVKSLKSLGL